MTKPKMPTSKEFALTQLTHAEKNIEKATETHGEQLNKILAALERAEPNHK